MPSGDALLNLFVSVIAMAVLFPACANSQSADISRWSLQLRTSGGFAGRGNGNVTISSEGKLVYEKPAAPGQARRPCEWKLSADELRVVDQAVRQSQPDGWKLPGPNAPAPDAFGYELVLRTGTTDGEQGYTVNWYDNTRDQLPDDLRRLSEAIVQARQSAAKKCAG